MKIIQIGNFPLNCCTIKGGVEASIFGITKALAKNNDVKIISFPNKLIEKDTAVSHEDFQVYYLSNPYKYNFLSIFRINTFISILKAFRPDVVHIHESTLLCLVILIYLRTKKINTVVTIHGVFYRETWKNFKRIKTVSNFLKFVYYSLAEYMVLLLAKKIIVDTKYVSDSLSKLKKKNYFIIPQGVNDSYFKLEDKYEINRIISIASISHRKGHEYSIRAIEILKNEFPDIVFHIVGSVSGEHQLYYTYLLRLIGEKKMEKNVIITPNLHSEALIQLLEKSNIFILHSYEESQGIAICEAMAAGKPVVATKIGGIPYVVEEDVNGKLCTFGDIETFADNIKTLLVNNQLRNSMGNASRKMSKEYAWNIIADKILKLY
ncbi:glycosyl transferase family 1 [Bacteroidia bacterium]|nr:glycosyl transferase family 1 [Bacteroidia bacterium]GHT27338.1 glycosyl transferase family 1 [Bacteroidia bacterium]